MIAKVLRKITYQGLTNVHEMAQITQRGESTVYRWINGESQPDFMSICKLANELPSLEARQHLLDYFTHSMPVAVHWTGDTDDLTTSKMVCDESNLPENCQPMAACVEAMDYIADAMRLVTQQWGPKPLESDQVLEATSLINRGISALMRSRTLINEIAAAPKSSSPVNPSVN